MRERDGFTRRLLAVLMMLAVLAFAAQALAEGDEDGEPEAPPVALALGAVAEGEVGVFEDLGARYVYQLEGEGPWLVTVKVTSQTGSLRVDDDSFGAGAGVYLGSRYPHVYEFRNVLPGGEFGFSVSRSAPYDYSRALAYTAVVTAERIPVDEVEDNDEFWLEVDNEDGDPTPNPNVLALTGAPTRGEIGIRRDPDARDEYYMDLDCYTLTLDEDATVRLAFKSIDHPLYYELFTLETEFDGAAWESGKPALDTAPLLAPVSNVREFALRRGVYGVVVGSITGMSGRYEISYADAGVKPIASVIVKKTAKLTAGGLPLDWDVVDFLPNFGFFEDYECWSSNPKVVDCSNGWPYSVNPGTATVTFDFGRLGKKSCKVTVYKNEFTRSRPLKLAAKGIYTSAKRMWYAADGSLCADIFVYNKTGKPISVISDMVLELRAGGAFGDVVFEKNLGAWAFGGKIPNNGFKVYRAKLSPEELQQHRETRFDLRNQEITATLDMNCSARGFRVLKLLETAKGVTAGRERARK